MSPNPPKVAGSRTTWRATPSSTLTFISPDQKDEMPPKCSACKDGIAQPFAFSMAFQPIVDVVERRAYAYEALVRGPEGQSAMSVISQVTEESMYSFDQSCRVQALTLASTLRLAETGARLSINFLPGAVYSPAACIQLTLLTAHACNFPLDRLIFEIVESERVHDAAHLQAIAREYKRHGFSIAIDDFGAEYANLNLLAELPADVLKLDMALVRNLHLRPRAEAIVNMMVRFADSQQVDLIAEGVETVQEYIALRQCGIRYMQGYLFAKPAFEALPKFTVPELQMLEEGAA